MLTPFQSPQRIGQGISASSFAEVPFKMLDTCHEDIAAMLNGLDELADQLGQPKARLEGLREKAWAAHLFFSGHAIEHHLDEERHVFPALLATGQLELLSVVRELRREHALLEARWARLGPLLYLLARGYHPAHQGLQDEIRVFVQLYRAHMATEDGVAYPMARHLLTAKAVSTMSLEMAHRRVRDPADEMGGSDEERWA